MARDLYARLTELQVELQLRGDDDLAVWIARQVAQEQEAEKRRRGARQKRRRRVKVVGAGGKATTAWIEQEKLKEGRQE